MKYLFFVSVAVGIFSGTPISGNAQKAVNSAGFAAQQKKSIQFIGGIEIKRDAQTAVQSVVTVMPENKPVVTKITDVTGKSVLNDLGGAIESFTSVQFKYAQLIDIDVELISYIKLYTSIENWWATRYRYGGTTKKGIDCSALTGALISEAYGMVLPRTAREQYAECEKVAREDLLEGDLVFFNTRGGVSHVGIYLGNSYFVHASVHAGVTINSLDDDYYNRKYIGGGRVNQE